MALDKEEKEKRSEERRLKKYNKTHKEINGVVYKQCNKHKENFPEEDDWFPCTEEYFYINKSNKSDGLCPKCKECSKAKSMDWKHNNIKRTSELRKRYRKKEENRKKEANRESNRKYRASEKYQQWLRDNPDKIKGYNKKRNNKNHKINKREWDSCKEYFNNRCAYCGLPIEEHFRKRLGEIQKVDLHKEHVYCGGRNDLKNCVPSCNTCNTSKHEASFNDWYNLSNPVYDKDRYHKICQWIRYDCKKYIEPPKPKGKYVKKNKKYWENKSKI